MILDAHKIYSDTLGPHQQIVETNGEEKKKKYVEDVGTMPGLNVPSSNF